MKIIYNEPFPYANYVNSLIPDDNVDSFGLYSVRDKTIAVYEDAKNLNLDDDIIKYLLYKEVRESIDIPKIDDNISFDIVSKTFYNQDIIQKLESYNPKCEYFRVMKYMITDIIELEDYLNKNQSYVAIKKYREIIKKLNLEAINPLSPEKELSEELNLRYKIGANKITDYKYRIQRQKYTDFGYSPTLNVRKTNYSRVCTILQKYLYFKMMDYYHKTGYFYRQINDNLDYFILNKVAFITYKYDDDLNIKIGEYDLNNFEFYARIFMPSFKANLTSFKIDSGYQEQFRGEIYYVPYKYMEEAFIKIINGPTYDNMTDSIETLELFNKIGFPIDAQNENKLLRNENVFFKDPRLVDELVVNQNKEYKTLNKIKSISYGEERNEYIKKLIARYKSAETIKVRNKEAVKKEIEEHSRKVGRTKENKEYID